jgi:hypothetical protein
MKDDKNKNQFDKRRKDNKTLSKKNTLTEDNKKEGTEDIKVKLILYQS